MNKNESNMGQSPQTEFTNDGNDSISSTRHSPKVRLTKTFYGVEEEKSSWHSWEDNMRLDAFF
jgi:hypothetical protein